jgi:hypothetical protein
MRVWDMWTTADWADAVALSDKALASLDDDYDRGDPLAVRAWGSARGLSGEPIMNWPGPCWRIRRWWLWVGGAIQVCGGFLGAGGGCTIRAGTGIP